jgi:uncharacterized membrane protein
VKYEIMSSNNNVEQDDQGQSGGYTGYRGNTAKQQRRPYNFSDEGEGQQAQDFGYGTGTRTAGQQQQQQQQQTRTQGQGAYQSPRSTAKGTTPVDATSTRLNARTEALLSYLFWWVSGLVFIIIERKNKYVRFHAVQSFLYLGAAAIVLGILKAIAGFAGGIFLLGFLLGPLFGFLFYAVGFVVVLSWLYLMVQAYRGKKTRIPYFGNFAERFSR